VPGIGKIRSGNTGWVGVKMEVQVKVKVGVTVGCAVWGCKWKMRWWREWLVGGEWEWVPEHMRPLKPRRPNL
jgi:hypothetical protein